MEGGKRNWYFPDGYIPAESAAGDLEAHEALMLFNTHGQPVEVRIDVYFSDRAPVKDISVTVPAERIISLRMDHPQDLGGCRIPRLTQYALRIRATDAIVAQFGRLDTTQQNLAYYVGVGFCE